MYFEPCWLRIPGGIGKSVWGLCRATEEEIDRDMISTSILKSQSSGRISLTQDSRQTFRNSIH